MKVIDTAKTNNSEKWEKKEAKKDKKRAKYLKISSKAYKM